MPTEKKTVKKVKKTTAKSAIDKSTEKKTLEAIKGSSGIISNIARKLGLSWHATEDRIKKYPSTLKAFQDEREGILDAAESTIVTAINNGDTGSAKWLLSTIGRKRGFTEKQEIELTGGINVTISPTDEKL